MSPFGIRAVPERARVGSLLASLYYTLPSFEMLNHKVETTRARCLLIAACIGSEREFLGSSVQLEEARSKFNSVAIVTVSEYA